MPEFDVSGKSRAVVVISYQPRWVNEFTRIAKHIRDVVGNAAVRIDHIGSTAVPGLDAKDVIDLQITVSDVDESADLMKSLRDASFRQGTAFQYDVFHNKPEQIQSCVSSSCGSRRATEEHIYISGNSGGSTSGTRRFFATIFAHRKTRAPSTNS
jgi:dephospho-CoA kinase